MVPSAAFPYHSDIYSSGIYSFLSRSSGTSTIFPQLFTSMALPEPGTYRKPIVPQEQFTPPKKTLVQAIRFFFVFFPRNEYIPFPLPPCPLVFSI